MQQDGYNSAQWRALGLEALDIDKHAYLIELLARTDNFGVVHEDFLSEGIKDLIFYNSLWAQIYINYRVNAWRRCEPRRMSPAFSDTAYDPAHSALINPKYPAPVDQDT